MRAIRSLSNDIRLLINTLHRGVKLPQLEGPEGPLDRFKARRRDMSRARVLEQLDD